MENNTTKRQFYRLDELDLPGKFRILDEENEEQYIPTNIRDLSAGGLSFVSDEDVDKGVKVHVLFKLEGQDLNIICEVMRVTEKGKRFEVGVKFHSIDQLEQDKIMGYIFQRQLELRRRGLR